MIPSTPVLGKSYRKPQPCLWNTETSQSDCQKGLILQVPNYFRLISQSRVSLLYRLACCLQGIALSELSFNWAFLTNAIHPTLLKCFLRSLESWWRHTCAQMSPWLRYFGLAEGHCFWISQQELGTHIALQLQRQLLLLMHFSKINLWNLLKGSLHLLSVGLP